ncbi:Uncharacterized protein SCF082_LOCUS49906 [Durusdinium trenchii]|uniref:Uncharacterized protein n=1 Tax=Durusdinium trenchii TaxID=1381693 RepID=A0ABP0S4E2_9DINO
MWPCKEWSTELEEPEVRLMLESFSRVRGQTVEAFIASSQDKTKNALNRSMEAAFNAFMQQLSEDQVTFEQQKILQEKSEAKSRAKLVRQLAEQHEKAWQCVREFMQNNLKVFTGLASAGTSTLLPSVASWVEETLGDIAEVRSSEDHLVVLWINLPTAGIVGAAKDDFFISLITNILTKYKRNSIALVVHANRAEQLEGSPGAKSEPDAAKSEVKDEDTPMKGEESDDGSDENENDKERPADSDVRDVPVALPHLGRAFTAVQELKQEAGGTDLVKRTLKMFTPPTASTVVLIDAHGYCAAPALATLEEISSDKRVLCGTIMLDQGAENLVKRVGSKVYDACRGGSLKLSGFPDFTGLVEAIQKGQASQVPKAYNVCVMKGESLRILKSLAQKFLDHELTHDKALGVIEDHNKKHNCDSDYLEPDAVNISISHHTITTEDRCPTPTSKPLVFVLDDPKDPEDKKAKKPKKGKKGKEGKDALTAKNFGSRVDTSKFKQGSKLILAWRVRLDVSEGANIVPIRPIAVLSGTLDLQQTTIRLL